MTTSSFEGILSLSGSSSPSVSAETAVSKYLSGNAEAETVASDEKARTREDAAAITATEVAEAG